MLLSKNFSLEELVVTNSKLPNVPTATEVNNLKLLVINVLQPLRDMYGQTIHVNSGYRSPAVNKAIGGAPTSQHCTGQAADLDCADNAKLFHLIANFFDFDQLIWEGGNDTQPSWVHVSYRSSTANRRQKLKMQTVNGKHQYITV